VRGRKTSDGFNAVVYTDVTEMKERETELAENSKRLELALEKEVELSSMKSNFVATASHEFRTPLTTIFSAADLLHHYSDQMDDKQRESYLKEIKQEVGDMTQLLDDILLVRKMEAGMFSFSPEKSNMELLLRNIVRASQNMAGNAHAIHLNIDCDGSSVLIDDSLIRHIVNNLLSNAIKYSPDGEAIEVTLSRNNGEIVLDVSDRGIGIPEDDVERVFDTFFRADNSSGIGGTGLGLSVVKTAVELHGGRIDVSSAVNEGTTFSVHIPDTATG
jgi:signal transduction histidine kinase